MNGQEYDVLSRRNFLKFGAVAAFAAAADSTRIGLKAGTAEGGSGNPNQIGFLFDQRKCVNCKMCAKSCENTMKWEEGTAWRRVLSSEGKQGYFLSISCNHCANPVCVSVCPVKAYTKREKDGIVIQNRDICVGCKYCMYACPYYAPQYSNVTGRISKCHFCFELLDGGDRPACVSACPMGALSFGLLNDIKKIPGAVARLEKLPDPEITKPSWAIIQKI